jgi:hypothetical protein
MCSFQPSASLNYLNKEALMPNRKAAIVLAAVAFLLGSACAPVPTAASDPMTPVQPSPSALAGARLSNLNGSYLGQADKLCHGLDEPMAIDQLSLEYEMQTGDLAGALLVKCDTGNCTSGVPLGTVTQCPKPPSPCDPGVRNLLEHGLAPACVLGDSKHKGTVNVLAMTPWESAGAYLVMAFFEDSGKRSNTVSTIVGRESAN